MVGIVALAACAGCATGTGASTAAGNANEGFGQAAPATPTQSCSGGYSYNRATGLCVSPGGM